MYTEADAKTKICPHLPVDVFVEEINNGVLHRVERYSQCRASGCMQWRWVMSGSVHGMEATDKGYCGLASKQ